MTLPLGPTPTSHTLARRPLSVRRPRTSLAGRALDAAGAVPVNSMLSVVCAAGAAAAVGALGGVRHGAAAGVVATAALAAAWPVGHAGRSGVDHARAMVAHHRGPEFYYAPAGLATGGRETASDRLARAEFERAVTARITLPRDGGRAFAQALRAPLDRPDGDLS